MGQFGLKSALKYAKLV